MPRIFLAPAAGQLADDAVTSAKIADGAIVNADINASAAIAKSKLAALAIVNTDVDAAAAIAHTKLAALTFTKPAFWNGTPTNNAVGASANQFRGSWVTIPVRTTFSTARVRVSTQAGNISVGLYAADGATRLATTGAVACPAAGSSDIAFTAAATVDPGVYFVGVSFSDATARVYGMDVGQLQAGAATGSAHPAPASVTVDDGSAGQVPVVGLY